MKNKKFRRLQIRKIEKNRRRFVGLTRAPTRGHFTYDFVLDVILTPRNKYRPKTDPAVLGALKEAAELADFSVRARPNEDIQQSAWKHSFMGKKRREKS